MKKRFTEGQIIGFLREAEAGLPSEPWHNSFVESFNGKIRD